VSVQLCKPQRCEVSTPDLCRQSTVSGVCHAPSTSLHPALNNVAAINVTTTCSYKTAIALIPPEQFPRTSSMLATSRSACPFVMSFTKFHESDMHGLFWTCQQHARPSNTSNFVVTCYQHPRDIWYKNANRKLLSWNLGLFTATTSIKLQLLDSMSCNSKSNSFTSNAKWRML